MNRIFFILGLLFIVQLSYGQELITDILQKQGDQGSNPNDFVEFNESVFFRTTAQGYGYELWSTNGNETSLLKDISPGESSSIIPTFTDASVILNNTLYFIANDRISKGEIWKTDGTSEGTVKVTDFLDANIYNLTLVGENFYFLIWESNLLQVWISDGTKAGTKMVKDQISFWNAISFQGKCNNTFIFTISAPGANDSRVWRSDGTADGTYPITEGIDGNGSNGGTTAPGQYIEYNNKLYFTSKFDLYATDGTIENTAIVKTWNAGIIDYGDVIEAKGKLYFSFYDFNYQSVFTRLSMWESDGTELGTNKIYDRSTPAYFITSNLIANDDYLIFTGPNNNNSTSLIKLSLTDNSTTFIKEVKGVSEKPFILNYITGLGILDKIKENKIFYSIPNDWYQWEGGLSGLTEETTNNYEALNNVIEIINYDDSFYFGGFTDLNGYELWKANPDQESFQLIENINTSSYGIENKPIYSTNSTLIFQAEDEVVGDEIRNYNGSTNLLKDIKEGTSGSDATSFIEYNDDIYFVANDNVHGYELWKTNGTESGTVMVHDIIEGASSTFPRYLTAHQGNLYFFVNINHNYHLYKSDGSNFEFVKELPYWVIEMVSAGDYLYFVTSGNGEDLWVSDGSDGGTYKLKDLWECSQLTDVDGKLFYVAKDELSHERELWYSDGTEVNTKLVKDIGLDYSSEVQDLYNLNGSLFFTAFTNETGRELWRSDGSEEETAQILDLNPGSSSSFIKANFYGLNNTLYFSASNGENGFELWKSDGTEQGTTNVADINSGADSSFPNEFTTFENEIYFQAYDNAHGTELWKSDGTATGTVLVADILDGVPSSSPSSIISIEEDIYFMAESTNKGRQIWKLSPNAITAIPESIAEIGIYPNPSADLIHFSTSANPSNIFIFNSNGQMMDFKKSAGQSLNISHLPSGLYILKFDLEGKTISQKIIKK